MRLTRSGFFLLAATFYAPSHAVPIINLSPVVTTGDDEDAIWLSEPDAYIENHSSVQTSGLSADGLRTSGLTATVINAATGRVETSGDDFAVGIRTAGDGIDIQNYGEIETFGINGDGIVVFGNGNAEGLLSIDDPANIQGNSVLNEGSILVHGAGGEGFVVEGDQTTFTNRGLVLTDGDVRTELPNGTPTHDNATTVYLAGSNNHLINEGGSIISEGPNSTTVRLGPQNTLFNSGLIANTGVVGGPTSNGSPLEGAAVSLYGVGATMTNVGTIDGNVIGGFGSQTINLGPGSVVNGLINADVTGFDDAFGADNVLNVDTGAGDMLLSGDSLVGFDSFMKTGTGTLSITEHFDLSSLVASGEREGGEALVNQGSLTLLDATLTSSQVLIAEDGRLEGTGLIVGDVFVQAGGFLAPGLSPGQLTIDGGLSVTGGTLIVELFGLGAGEFDTINVLGTADLTNAIVEFVFDGSFLPSANDTFDFLLADNVLGLDTAFFSYSGLAGGLAFDISTLSGGSGLRFTALNDVVAQVPEPETLALLLLGLVGLYGSRSKRRRQPAPCARGASSSERLLR